MQNDTWSSTNLDLDTYSKKITSNLMKIKIYQWFGDSIANSLKFSNLSSYEFSKELL